MSARSSPPHPAPSARPSGGRPEARGGRHPRLRRRPGQGVLRRPRLAARRRLRLRQRLPGRPVHPPGRRPRSSSAPTSPPPRPARPRASTWSSPTSRRRATSSRPAASRSARSSTRRRRRQFRPTRSDGRVGGPADDGASYGSFATFSDPDGNALAAAGDHHPAARPHRHRRDDVRLGERPAQALLRAATAHGEHEKRNGGEYDEHWPDWYTAYLVAEQSGTELPRWSAPAEPRAAPPESAGAELA